MFLIAISCAARAGGAARLIHLMFLIVISLLRAASGIYGSARLSSISCFSS